MSKRSSNSNKNKELSNEVKKGASKVGRKKGDIKKTSDIKKTTEMVQWEFSHSLAFWGLAVLLFLPPFFRGLFFQPDQEKALIFATILFWIVWMWKWLRRDNSFLSHPLDYFVLAFPLVYLISAFQAANYGLAVDDVVKATLYFLVYWLVSRLVRGEQEAETLLRVIYTSAVLVALAGLATATGIIHINDGFLAGRIYSTFQYPNALASFLAVATFLGLYLWLRTLSPVWLTTGSESALIDGQARAMAGSSTKKSANYPAWLNMDLVYRYLYSMGNFILFAVFLGTKSKGGFLLFAIAIILFFAGLPRGRRVPAVIHFILFAATAGLAIWRFLAAVGAEQMDAAWGWVFLGLFLVTALQIGYDLALKRNLFQWIAEYKRFVVAGLIALVLIAGIGLVNYTGKNIGRINEVLSDIKTVNIKTGSAFERVYFNLDALHMFRDRPLLGWGGGGWQEAYRTYQSYLYDSNQVHGYYLQVMVETGLLGILAVLGIWAFFLILAHQQYHGAKDAPVHRMLVWVLTIAAVFTGLHAAIDFNLSLSALMLVLLCIFGIMRALSMEAVTGDVMGEAKRKPFEPLGYQVPAVISCATLAIVVFSGMLISANNYKMEAAKYLQSQNVAKGVESLKNATAVNPLDAGNHSNLSSIYQQQGKIQEAETEAQRAVSISKYSALRYVGLANVSSMFKKNEEAVTFAEKAITLAPFQVQWYEFLSRIYFVSGYNELISGNGEISKQYLIKAIEIPARIDAKMASVDKKRRQLWILPVMKTTPALQMSVGTSQYLLGNQKEADENLRAALQDENTKGEASLWLAVLRDRQGRTQESQDLLAQAQKLAPEMAKGYEGLKVLQTLSQR